MTTMLLYNNIAPLNRDQHRKLRLRPSAEKAGFARGTHFVPLAGVEFFRAARDIPIFFASDQGGGPIALLGLRENENLFIEEDGAWRAGTYAPAFIRRYPFVLASGDDKEQVTVCIDDSFSGFSEEEGERLFDDEGKETEYLTRMVDFLNRFSADMQATRAFMEKLEELELLMTRSLRIDDTRGRTFQLNSFRIIDEEKLAKLDDKTLGELHRQGWLGWIHAHLLSLANVDRLSAHVPMDDKQDAKSEA